MSAKKPPSAKAEYVYGIHAVAALLEVQPLKIKQLFLQKGRDDERARHLAALAYNAGITVQYAERASLDKLCADMQHQGVVALFHGGSLWHEQDLPKLIGSDDSLLLILDGVTDPQNLGAALRVANGAGVAAIIAPRDRAATLSASARKVACGAAEYTPFIQVGNLARSIKNLKQQGFWIIGLDDAQQQSFYSQKLSGKIALMLGAEGKGLRRLSRELCDQLVALPMHGQVSSLNVATAAAICLYEAVRQRS